ncbi:MAG: (2Fe-2S) ferredoxin domain-containing protein [Thermoanaerobaculia bacterium]
MPKPKSQLLICVNERPPGAAKPCCAARDGLALYQEFKDRVKARGLRDDVLVTRTGCLKHCSRGVTVVVWPGNLWYGGVTAADVDEILDRSALGGAEIERLAMPAGPWE